MPSLSSPLSSTPFSKHPQGEHMLIQAPAATRNLYSRDNQQHSTGFRYEDCTEYEVYKHSPNMSTSPTHGIPCFWNWGSMYRLYKNCLENGIPLPNLWLKVVRQKVLGSSSKTLRIPEVGPRWRWAVSLMLPPLYPWGDIPVGHIHLIRGRIRPTCTSSGRGVEKPACVWKGTPQ